MSILDEEDVVTIDIDDNDGPSSKKSKNEENETRRSSRRGKDKADDDWTPTNKNTKKSALSLTYEKEEGTSQRKRARSPSPNNEYQKASRRTQSQRENGTNYKVSNDTLAQMLGVALARLEKLETDWKKKLELEQKLEDLETTMNTMKEDVMSLKGKVEDGAGSGAILPIMEKLDRVKEDVGDSKKLIDKMNGRVACVEDLTDTYDKRFEGLKVKLRSNMDRLTILEKKQQYDTDTIESHSQKLDSLERATDDLKRGKESIKHSVTPSSKISLPHIATPEQLRQLPQLPMMPNDLGNLGNPNDLGNSANEEELISPGQISDILKGMDEETAENGDASFQIPSSLNSDLPLFSQDEVKAGSDKFTGNTSNSSFNTSEITNKQVEDTSMNVTKSAPVKISLLSFKKKTPKETQEKQSISTDDKKNNEERQGDPISEAGQQESPSSEADTINDSNDADSSAPKKKNKFFTSKN